MNIITVLIRLGIIAVTVIIAVILIIIFAIYAVTVISSRKVKILKNHDCPFCDVPLRAASILKNHVFCTCLCPRSVKTALFEWI